MRDSLKVILTAQVAMLVAIGLDIPIMRQIIVFICTSFIPGFLILKILKLNLKSRVNTLLFSVGLSVAFLMFVGLLVNELYPLIGVSEPLSTLPLLVTIFTLLLVMSFISHRRVGSAQTSSSPSPSHIFLACLLVGVPLLAIFGALLKNSLGLLLMVALISVLVVLAIFSKKLIPVKLYSFIILIIAVSMLFQYVFTGFPYLIGHDVFSEFYVFKVTKLNSSWNPTIPTTEIDILNYNSMLSVTILPAIYSNLLNIRGEWVFQVVFPLLFSLVPISLYMIYQQQRIGKHVAFLSVFYFIIFPRFYTMTETRQIIGELFFALSILLLVCKNISPRERQILLITFGISMIVSHYALSYFYMFCIFFTCFFMFLIKKLKPYEWKSTERTVSPSFALLFFVMALFWYAYVSRSPLISFQQFIGHILRSFSSFLILETRGESVERSLSPGFDMSFTQQLDQYLNKLPYLFIVLEFINVFRLKTSCKEMKFEWGYALMMAANFCIFIMVLVIPGFGPAFQPARYYHVSLFFLAPLCVLGCIWFFEWILRLFTNIAHRRATILKLVCIFLVIIFLFKVGFIYEVTGDVPTSKSINFTRMKTSHDPQIKAGLYDTYVPEQDIYSAIWLSEMARNNSKIYADEMASEQVLRAYGMKIIEWEYLLFSDRKIETDAYVYLRYLNVHGLLREHGTISNITEISYQLKWANKIYSNGDGEIYRSFSRD